MPENENDVNPEPTINIESEPTPVTEPEPESEVIGRGKRTFVLYEKMPDVPEEEAYNEISRFRGSGPGNAASKAASRGHEDIIIRETKKRKFRHYKGKIVDELLLGPRVKWQIDLAVKNGTFLKTADGTLPAEWKDVVHDPDGILIESDPDYIDDPVLKGRCPIYKAKVGSATYIKTEPIPNEMKLSAPSAAPTPVAATAE